MKVKGKPQSCICGFSIVGTDEIIAHKTTCERLRHAVRDDIQRIGKMLGRRCGAIDYKLHRDKSLPSHSWLAKYWGNWGFVSSGLTEEEYRKSIIDAAIAEVKRLGEDLAGSSVYAPTLKQYEKHKLQDAPGVPSILAEGLGVPVDKAAWAKFVETHTGLRVLTQDDLNRLRSVARVQRSQNDTGSPIEFIDEKDMAMTGGLLVSSAYSVPLPNGNYEVTYVLR